MPANYKHSSIIAPALAAAISQAYQLVIVFFKFLLSPSNAFDGGTAKFTETPIQCMVQIWSLHDVQSKLILAPLSAYRATDSDWNRL